MKLLTDFDGVWTFPADEGRAQGEVLEETLLEWTEAGRRDAVRAWLAAARRTSAAEPTRWGWASAGRLSAFGDEDPFIVHSALMHYLGHVAETDAVARALRDAIRDGGHESIDAFGGHTHARGVERVVAVRGPGILPAAAEAGRRMIAAGVEVVAVSNSTPEKLLRWFEHAGVPAVPHPERTAGALRVRGSARKFVLGPPADPLVLGDTSFDVSRPSYETILRDEIPDAVVGDVFSLDLALPLALKRREPAFAATRLFWLIHPYTPAWLRRVVETHAGSDVEQVEGGLPAVADRLVAASRQDRTS